MNVTVMPRISDVSTRGHAFVVAVIWSDGREDIVDLSDQLERFTVYRPLRDGTVQFTQVHVGEYGTDLVWTDEIDMAADTLARLATEQAVPKAKRAGSAVLVRHR